MIKRIVCFLLGHRFLPDYVMTGNEQAGQVVSCDFVCKRCSKIMN